MILQLHHEPAVLVLTRQAVPTIDRTKYAPASGLARGAYILADPPGGNPEVILIGTGSEVALCLEAYEQLTKRGSAGEGGQYAFMGIVRRPGSGLSGIRCLPPQVKARVSVEEASDFGWSKYTGSDGHNICIESFGASAPIKQLLKKFGFSVGKHCSRG